MAFDSNILDFDVLTVIHPPWIPAAQAGLYVLTTDARLSDARTPLAHTHPASDIIGLSTGVSIRTGGIPIGTRPAINFIPGINGLTVSGLDNPGSGQVDLSFEIPAVVPAIITPAASTASLATQVSLDAAVAALAELQSDFDKLLAWVILNFGTIPQGLETDAEQALEVYASN